ncbi:hypothetical protein [Marinactinospora rubrisoli]|uniref:Uncharacterized protein n=1 Tax=Marinactinospora rubrisoli TaxID=2715399 RepID=A0ABW2KPZ1_9ACTN
MKPLKHWFRRRGEHGYAQVWRGTIGAASGPLPGSRLSVVDAYATPARALLRLVPGRHTAVDVHAVRDRIAAALDLAEVVVHPTGNPAELGLALYARCQSIWRVYTGTEDDDEGVRYLATLLSEAEAERYIAALQDTIRDSLDPEIELYAVMETVYVDAETALSLPTR